MQTKTRASAVKIYLFFLFISLFAVSGCGLDIDFGGDGNGTGVEGSEIIEGFIIDIIPQRNDEVSNLTIRVVNRETSQDYQLLRDCRIGAGNSEVEDPEQITGATGSFCVKGDFDPEAEFRISEIGSEDSPLGVRKIAVFPGAMIDIGDISLRGGNIEYTEDINIDFNMDFQGRVSTKNCLDATGSIEVEIDSNKTTDNDTIEVLVQIKSDTDIQTANFENLGCDSITVGDKVRKLEGILLDGITIKANFIEIE